MTVLELIRELRALHEQGYGEMSVVIPDNEYGTLMHITAADIQRKSKFGTVSREQFVVLVDGPEVSTTVLIDESNP